MIEYIPLVLLFIVFMFLALVSDRANHHPYLGLGDEQSKIENGAEWHDCPDCGGETAVYEKESGETICGNCGAGVDWSPERGVYLGTSGEEREPYDWR